METIKYFFAENKNIPESLKPTTYYAYVDKIEVLENGQIEFRLDCVDTKSFRSNSNLNDVLSLPSIIINIYNNRDFFQSSLKKKYLRYIEGKWIKFVTKSTRENPLQVSYFGINLTSSGVGLESISTISELSTEEKAGYKNLINLMDINKLGREVNDEEIQNLWDQLLGFDHVCIYKVGQGNLNALCDQDNAPLLYFDMGGGQGPNARDYQNPLTICTRYNPPVVLSHWDMDHIQTALLSNQSHALTWFVPQQVLGLNHFILAYTLSQQNRLIRLNNTIANGHFSILKCNGTTKNDTGLALLISIPEYDFLLPADANYRKIPLPNGIMLNGLVATHHGSRKGLTYYRRNVIPDAHIANMLVFSYGFNIHGHNPNNVIQLYQNKGWSVNPINYKVSPNGNIRMNFGPVNLTVPCVNQCNLDAVQSF